MFEYAQILDDTSENDLLVYLYAELLFMNDTNSTYYGYLGNVLLKLDLYNESYLAYQKAKSIQPNQSWIEGNIGNLLNNKGFYTLAKEYLDTSLELDNNSTYAQQRLSSVLENIEKEQKKRKECEKRGLEMYMSLINDLN